MGKCRYCDRKGFFLSVDSNGLCGNCSSVVVHDIAQRGRIMDDSFKLAREGKTFSTRLSRCDLLLEHAEQLYLYEQKGIPTIDPQPSRILSEYRPYRESLIVHEAQKAAQKAISKAELAITPSSKQNALGSGVIKVQEIFEQSSDPSTGLSIVNDLKSQMHKAKYEGFLEAAKKAEFKGNSKKAIDQYQEALFFIRNDDVPDEQQKNEIEHIESKLKDLGEGTT